MKKIIEVQNLVKSYGTVKAVRGISFYAETGSLFALLGENGAGKSTTIDMLSTLSQPDGGGITICNYTIGREDEAIRSKIGIVFQQSLLDADLTVKENLQIRGSLYGLSRKKINHRIDSLSQSLNLSEFLNRNYGKLSGGQRRRADIARALLHEPELLILDEPTTGLDPVSRKAIWQTVRDLQQNNGTSVLLTTHYMEEAASADYVVIMGHGKILAKGTSSQLKTQFAHDTLTLEVHDSDALIAVLSDMKADYKRIGNRFTVRLDETRSALPMLAELQAYISSFEVTQGSLEDAFLRIIKEGKEVTL
ncbi:ABC transporter ATP-binding protein [Clostridium sp. 19966]|uniref:ABC transporter ATP-binding protein n=1 Tax=Clostridium sp. 19966 TaxID=2768166 RepID=UPI0028DEC056|nr:ABC transporter ATP-binding protein [Clostridium sp. 19966]MDT8718013.1 ABC transporter ATP-binding protein [Clostridium sp. 19966]